MSNRKESTQNQPPRDQHSEEYKVIRQEIKAWPAWKVESYNVNFATSAHAQKIEVKAK